MSSSWRDVPLNLVEDPAISAEDNKDNVPLTVLAIEAETPSAPVSVVPVIPIPDVLEDKISCRITDLLEEVGFPTAENSSVSSLDKNILALFGDADQLTATLGPRIHPDIANRWASLLGQGLPETTLSVLLRKYPSPVTRRDANLVELQNQSGAVLSAVGLLTHLISEGRGENRSYIEFASDAARLLLDCYNRYSVILRELIHLNLRKDLKDTLTEVSADGWMTISETGSWHFADQ
ncbi:hypothetical protein ABEB36_009359 [Hypothenemus hampei]|uniref:Uncharacterized protein n=1 Tax=Hypothenemus hampei TaxID=57062 RepID=A0ABD1EGC3_HYPHA